MVFILMFEHLIFSTKVVQSKPFSPHFFKKKIRLPVTPRLLILLSRNAFYSQQGNTANASSKVNSLVSFSRKKKCEFHRYKHYYVPCPSRKMNTHAHTRTCRLTSPRLQSFFFSTRPLPTQFKSSAQKKKCEGYDKIRVKISGGR